MREKIRKAVSDALEELGVEQGMTASSIEHPSEMKNGDYSTGVALACAKRAGVSPLELAQKIVAAIDTIEGVSKIEIAGPGFINFHLSNDRLAQSLREMVKADMWGANNTLAAKKIMVEYTDPNPFKEFHIGHLMSNAIGESISRLVQFSGGEVDRANYQGDVGPHVAKAIWGVQTLGLDAHDAAQLGKAYAVGSQAYESDASAKEAIDTINAKVYDRSDSAVNEVYDAGRAASLEHFEQLYSVLGTKFDHYFFESETAPIGLSLVRKHKDVFEESDGAIVYKGEQDGLHTRVFVTSKGLPTYETKELGLAQLKEQRSRSDISITITAHEQSDYFAVVLAVMKKVLPEIAPKILHISHGMMRLSTGKMSSRTGDVVTGESLLNDLVEQAKVRAAESRADDHDKLAQEVAVAAVKYQILKQGTGKDIIFDREQALSLEGDSGPYLQYAHARAHQLVERAKNEGIEMQIDEKITHGDLTRLLPRFPEIVERAASEHEPHFLTTYLLQVASEFNSWYAQEQILDGTPAAAHKVALTAAVARTLKNGLWLLGIPAPEKM